MMKERPAADDRVSELLSEKNTSSVRHMFDRIAPHYDRLNHTLSMSFDRYWRRKAIGRLKSCKPQRMLDVATGTADFAIAACRGLNPRRIDAIDLSEGMLDIARQKLEARHLEKRICLRQADGAQLPFDDGTFDAVTVAFGIRNFEHLEQGLAQMWRVLKPGGKLVILELTEPQGILLKQLYRWYARSFIPRMGSWIANQKEAYTYLPRSIRLFPQGEKMKQIIHRVGFNNVRFTHYTLGICTLYEAVK